MTNWKKMFNFTNIVTMILLIIFVIVCFLMVLFPREAYAYEYVENSEELRNVVNLVDEDIVYNFGDGWYIYVFTYEWTSHPGWWTFYQTNTSYVMPGFDVFPIFHTYDTIGLHGDFFYDIDTPYNYSVITKENKTYFPHLGDDDQYKDEIFWLDMDDYLYIYAIVDSNNLSGLVYDAVTTLIGRFYVIEGIARDNYDKIVSPSAYLNGVQNGISQAYQMALEEARSTWGYYNGSTWLTGQQAYDLGALNGASYTVILSNIIITVISGIWAMFLTIANHQLGLFGFTLLDILFTWIGVMLILAIIRKWTGN